MSTIIGRVNKVFDWLGTWLTDKGITGVAPRALVNHEDKIPLMYEKNRNSPKGRQAKWKSAHSTWWNIWAAVLCMGMPSAFAVPTPPVAISPGDTYRASTSGTWAATGGTGVSQRYDGYLAGAFTIRRTINENGTNFQHCSMFPADFQYQTSDGWVGIKIATDVVLGLTGTATGSYYIDSNPIINATGTWTDQGVFTVSPPNSYSLTWCGGTNSSSLQNYSEKNRLLPASFTGTVFIHAGPNAAPGTYTVPGLTLSRMINEGWSYPSPTYLFQSGSITVTSSTVCTISLQDPSVNFGSVQQNNGDNQLLSVFPSQLNINCDSAPGVSKPMSISFTGLIGRYTDTLALNDTGGEGVLAEVRGVRATGTGTCDNNNDRIQFQGQQYSIGNVSGGLTSIPLTWSLCSNRTGGMGAGTAQATVTLTWP
ncbi:hypothetical protein [Serratia fonticola]